MGKIVHFEELWDKSEKLASGLNITEPTEILGKISSVVDEIRDIYKAAANAKDKQLVQGMKSKALGRMLLNISALSAKENIDVYAALKDQLDIHEIKESIKF